MVTRALAVLAAAVLAAPVGAQSSDPAFLKEWTWSPQTLASEATGMGGAFAATAQGSEALYWSPAAMTFGSGLDIRMSIGVRPGIGVVRHGDKLHIGFGVRRTFSRTHRAEGFIASDSVFEVGRLSVMIDQAAFGAGVRSGRLRLGASLQAGPVKTDGAWSRVEAAGTGGEPAREVRYDYASLGEWQIGGSASAIVDVLGPHPMARQQLRFALATRWPTLVRTAHYRRSRLLLHSAGTMTPLPASVPAFEGSGPDSHVFRVPPTVSVGAEARLSVLSSLMRSLRVSVGADWTDYDTVLETARANDAQGGESAGPLSFDGSRDWEMGGGLEGVFPAFRLRVGIRERASHNLGTAVRGSRDWQPVGTFGLSRDVVISSKRLQFDFDSISWFERVLLSARLIW